MLLFISIDEFSELRIVDSLLNVEGEREVVEWVLADRLIIHLHVVEESFLVAKMEVVLEVITHHRLNRFLPLRWSLDQSIICLALRARFGGVGLLISSAIHDLAFG